MEIATPVCALARNDREFVKFQFVSVLTKADSLNTNLGVPQSILRQALS